MRMGLAVFISAVVLAGCGGAPSPPASESQPAPPTTSTEPSAPSPPPVSGLDCGESMIGGQLWQGRDGGAGVYNPRHRFIAVRWPPGYTIDYGSFRIFNSFTLYDAHGRKVADGGDTLLIFGEWEDDERKVFVACAVGRVVAANPESPRNGFILPIDACVVWQGTQRDDRFAPNPFLVPDGEVCGQFPIL